MRKYALYLLFLCGIIIPFAAKGQNQHIIDSLQQIISTTKNDSQKVEAYFSSGMLYLSQPTRALEIAAKMLDLALVITNNHIKALCIRKAGNIYFRLLQYEKAVKCYIKSVNLYEQIGDRYGIANCYNNLGNTYTSQGKLTSSMNYFNMAIDYHTRALKIRTEINDAENMANSYNNMANAYSGKGDLEKALEYYLLAFKDYKARNDANGIDMVTMNLGDTHLRMGMKNDKSEHFGKALEYFLDRVRYYKGYGPAQNYAAALSRIGEIYMLQGDMGQSLKYLNDAVAMSAKIRNKEALMTTHSLLAEAYNKTGDYKKAYDNLMLFNHIKDSVINEKTTGSIAQMQTLYETNQKNKEIELLNKAKEIQALEIENNQSHLHRQRYVIISSVIGLVLLLGLALLLYNRNMIRTKANRELSQAYKKIEQANRHVTDSINYAKRIQDAILLPENIIGKHLDSFFVFFRPRDIVSGDFYWFSEHGNRLFIAVADCTGHGVPGAFMSMIGNTLLNEIVNRKNITEPGLVLEALHDGVRYSLHQDRSDFLSQDDGMDISFCCIENDTIKFAGANHSIYISNGRSVTILKGDIHSIGGSLGKAKRTFSTQTFPAAGRSWIFMGTDGYYDQFGGSDGAKFMTPRFEKLIAEAALDNQPKTVIEKAFISWKGNNRQIDDVLVAGFRMQAGPPA